MAKSHLLGPGSLKIGTTGTGREWAAQVTAQTLTPSTDYEDDVPTLDGETLEGDATETWALGGTILQDYDAESLELFCYDNRNKWMPFEFTPNTDHAVSWAGECRVNALTIGGDVKKKNTSDFEFQARDVAPVVGA
jgi:hypothetical protein